MKRYRLDLEIISKIFFLLYIIYINIIRYSLFQVKGLKIFLLTGAVLSELLSDGFKAKSNRSLIAYVVFFAYILGSGSLVATNYSIVISSSLTFAESLLAVYLVITYTIKDNNVYYAMNAYVVQGLFAVLLVFFRGTGVKRISIAESVNVNTIGIMLAFSIGFILYMLIRESYNPLRLVVSIGCIIMMIAGILLTSSKKGIISAAAMIFLWFVFSYRFTFKKLSTIKKFVFLVFIVTVVAVAYSWFSADYSYQIEIFKLRMSRLYVGDADQDRIRLFKEGISLFFSHPLFGVGLNNSRYYSFRNTYTHSFYSELFACTGVFGASIFLYALFRPFIQIHHKILKYGRQKSILKTRVIYMQVMFLTMLIISFAQIIFYHPTMMYLVGVFTGYASISFSYRSS